MSSFLYACNDSPSSFYTEINDTQRHLKQALLPQTLINPKRAEHESQWQKFRWRWMGEIRLQGKLHGVFLQAGQISYYFAASSVLPESSWSVKEVTHNTVILENKQHKTIHLYYTK